MRSFIEYLGCGRLEEYHQDSVQFSVTKFSDIHENIIPFFDKHPILGSKLLDYADFRKVAEIMKVKGHLTIEGLEEIQKIKARMNKGR